VIGPMDALKPELDRLDVLIEAEIRRMRARYELSQQELLGLHVSDEQVDALLAANERRTQPRVRPSIRVVRGSDDQSRWSLLGTTLGLSDDERDLVLLCAAPEIEPNYEPIYAYLNDDAARRWPTIDLAVRVLTRDASHAAALRGLLLPTARLASLGLVKVMGVASDTQRSRRALRLATPVSDWLRGLSYADDRLTTIIQFGALEQRFPDIALPTSLSAVLPGLAPKLLAREPIPNVLLVAPAAREALLYGEELFARAHRLAMIISLSGLATHPSPADAIDAAALQASLLNLAVIIHFDDESSEPNQGLPAIVAGLVRRLIHRLPTVVIAAGPGADVAAALGDISLLRVDLPELHPQERAQLWRLSLTADPRCARAPGAKDLAAVADRFNLGPDRVIQAAETAIELAELAGKASPNKDMLFSAARMVSMDGAAPGSTVVRTNYDWNDLILPIEVKERLEDVIAAIDHRSLVLDEWGLARRTGGERGIAIMLAGPSGTGKTMAASVLARRLHIDLQKINIGSVMSKYIGETEKNLDKCFETARRTNSILFIDEADALLGKRSEVRSPQDRYANVEVSYLLQKMETFDGIIIIATNLPRNIDDAFSRRMHYVINFPLPDAATRERLWRGMLADNIPCRETIDFPFLARQFDLSGGEIRNIVLDAAYTAARWGESLSFAQLLRAISRQYTKRGQVLTATDLREHQALLVENIPRKPRRARSVRRSGTAPRKPVAIAKSP